MNLEPRGRNAGLLIAAAAALCIAAALVSAQRGASDPAAAALSYIVAHNSEALTLIERLVNINSGTHNFDGVREVGRIIRAELDGLGFKTEWIDGAAWQRAGHLAAERPGRNNNAGGGARPRGLLIRHLDTVFERDSPFQRFEPGSRTAAPGPGVIDLKRGDGLI